MGLGICILNKPVGDFNSPTCLRVPGFQLIHLTIVSFKHLWITDWKIERSLDSYSYEFRNRAPTHHPLFLHTTQQSFWLPQFSPAPFSVNTFSSLPFINPVFCPPHFSFLNMMEYNRPFLQSHAPNLHTDLYFCQAFSLVFLVQRKGY